MPRQSTRSQTTRRIIQDQETFDFTTPNLKVQASPVDAFVQPMGMTGSARALLNAFATGKEAYGEWKENKDQKDFEAGGMAQASGQGLDTGKSAAWITGFESMSGQAATSDFEDALNKYHQENWQADPEAYAAGREQLLAGFIEGKSEAFMKNFVPRAAKIEEQFTSKYRSAQLGQLQLDMRTNAGKATRAQLDDIMTNPDMAAQAPQLLRQQLSTQQEQMKQYGMSRTDVSKDFIQAVGLRAIQDGNPELMLFATEKDASGMALADNPELATEILSFTQRAEAARDSAATAAAAQEKKQIENVKNYVERELVERLYNLHPNDKKGMGEVIEILRNASDPGRNPYKVALDAKDMEHYYKLIREMQGGDGINFAIESDPRVYQDTWTKAAAGRLTNEELWDAQRSLSRADFNSVFKTQAEASSRRLSGSDSSFTPVWNTMRGDVEGVLDQSNPLMGVLDNTGKEKVRQFTNKAYIKLAEYREANEGKNPTSTEIFQMLDSAKKEVEAMFGTAAPTTTTSAPAAPQPAEAGDQREKTRLRIERIRAQNAKR